MRPQLKELARIWEEVFPESKGLDGEHVERLFHYGDHDNGGYMQVPSLRYVTYENGHDNKPNGYHAEQGMVLNVYDDMMSLRRLDFTNGKLLGPTWDIPLGDKTMPYARETRRRAAPVPEFPADAMLSAAIEETAARGGHPELPAEPLIADFFNGYYGKGAPLERGSAQYRAVA